MSERKLATVQRIDALRPIEGADAIEVADVLGWHVVVKKGEFQVGDLCVYCEVDSVLPEREEFEFLRDRKFRIKTIKLRGQISQGICFPIGALTHMPLDFYEGDDVTELLGIIKYEPPIPACLRGLCRGSFPGFLQKTDEERIQTCSRTIDNLLQGGLRNLWYVSEKLDGTSFTSALRINMEEVAEFYVCSRGMNLKLEGNDDNLYVKVAQMLELDRKLREKSLVDIAVQGEILAPGVQKNKYGVTGPVLRCFSVFDIKLHRYVPLAQMEHVVGLLGLETVPILDRAFVLPLKNGQVDVDALVEYSIAPSMFQPKLAQREGVVIRHVDDSNVSFKVINPKFLLKFDE